MSKLADKVDNSLQGITLMFVFTMLTMGILLIFKKKEERAIL